MDFAYLINVIAVSTSQDEAAALLSSCFTGLQTSDSQEWTTVIGNFTVRCYTKYPGTDIHRRGPENHLDYLLVKVDEGHEKESEIHAYGRSRLDCKNRFSIDRTVEGFSTYSASDVLAVVTEGSNAISKFNDAYKSQINKSGDLIYGENNISELVKSQLNYTDDNLSKMTSGLVQYDKETYEQYITYNSLRRLFCSATDLHSAFVFSGKLNTGLTKFAKRTSDLLNSFSSFDTSRLTSNNHAKFEFVPTSNDSDGVGFTVELVVGEDFNKENSNLPLTVRDNIATVTVELHAKEQSGVDSILATLEMAKQMADQMGLLEMLKHKFGLILSFSKEGSSVFVDFTAGGLLGEDVINRIRSLNLEKFKFNFNDFFRFQTGVNVKDLYEDFDLNNIVEKVCRLSVIGEGTLLNVRSFLHLIRENVNHMKREGDQKNLIMVSYGLLILSCFENLGLTLKYDSKDLKANLVEIADTMNGEGFYEGIVAMANGSVSEGILPMVFGTIEGVKPMLGMFGEGLAAINFDKLSVEVLVPSVRTSFRSSVLLPGLTEFIEKKVLN